MSDFGPAAFAQEDDAAPQFAHQPVDYPRQQTLPHLFALQVQRTPDAVALICGEQKLSYRELEIACDRLMGELQSRGIGRGSLVGICLDRSPELLIGLLAVLKAGGAYVPLDPAYPRARLAQILEDARPAAVLSKTSVHECLPANDAALILLDANAAAAPASDSPLVVDAQPDDLAYVIYTSGSTGKPKGVQIPHRALTNLLWAMRSQPGLCAGDVLLAVTTVSFDIAALELFLPLIVGAKLVIADEMQVADGAVLSELMRAHGATLMQATPVTWQILLASGWQPAAGFKMLCGGEALTRTLAEQLLRGSGELWNMYGPTETTIWSSALRVQSGSGPVAVGPPIANTQFYVLDENAQPAPDGADGELYIGGDGVARGYQNLPELTKERFVPDRFLGTPGARLYRTGDRVRLRADGSYDFLGRADHQIKLRGFRIELGEIEFVLQAHAQVAESVVTAAPDASGEQALRAYVVARTPAALNADAFAGELRSRVQQSLPAYMCPSQFIVLESLPRMPNGKIDRAALPLNAPGSGNAGAPEPPLSVPERRLAKIWSEVLVISDVSADANFFEIGGHSLLAVRLLARIEKEFGCKLTLAALFKNPTLAAQARLLNRSEPQDYDFRQVLQLQAGGARPPLIAINNTGIYYLLAKHLGPDQPFTSLQLFDPALSHPALPRTLEDIAAEYVRLIRRVQPAGPYALLGWCVAGTLAFEVARQLTACGQRVSQLILFDTLIPGYLRRLPWLRALLADYSFRWKLITADWKRTRSAARPLAAFLSNRTIIKTLLRWLRLAPAETPQPALTQNDSLSPEQYDQWLLQYLEDAAIAYEPKPYAGSMILFRSSEEPMGRFLDPKMGWGDFVEGGITLEVIEGDHFSIFREPSVSRIAQRIALLSPSPCGRG